jgi:predicted nucleotide-binding protein (sugar kinase/HSP70/actin superfamily)
VECGFKVVLSDTSSTGLFEKGSGSVMSDNICFPAKLVHGHIINLIEKNVDRIFYPTVVYENKEYCDIINSFNCLIVTGYPDVIRSSIVREFGISKRLVCQAVEKGLAAHRECKDQLKRMAVNIIDNAGKNNRLVIVLAGRPYHVDPLINHGIPEWLAGMGVDVIPEDAVPIAEECTLKDSNILKQWSYTNRFLTAAKYVVDTEHIELVQIISFGC